MIINNSIEVKDLQSLHEAVLELRQVRAKRSVAINQHLAAAKQRWTMKNIAKTFWAEHKKEILVGSGLSTAVLAASSISKKKLVGGVLLTKMLASIGKRLGESAIPIMVEKFLRDKMHKSEDLNEKESP